MTKLNQRRNVGDVWLEISIDIVDGKEADSLINFIGGGLCVSGEEREEFLEKLKSLFREYRI